MLYIEVQMFPFIRPNAPVYIRTFMYLFSQTGLNIVYQLSLR